MNKTKILYITPLRGGIGHWSRCLIDGLDKLADVVVFPYVVVSQNGTMFTTLGMKRPVIISKLGSFIRKLEKEGVILTSKPKDPKSVAEKMLYLLKHEEERKELAEGAYQILKNEYSWDIIAREYYDIFKNLTMKS